jgi:hypothetical protein
MACFPRAIAKIKPVQIPIRRSCPVLSVFRTGIHVSVMHVHISIALISMQEAFFSAFQKLSEGGYAIMSWSFGGRSYEHNS